MPRMGKTDLLPMNHNMPLTIIGGTLIFVGWYFFNGASTFAANGLSATTFMNTHISACMSGLVWVSIAYFQDHHFHITEILNGMLAGLAGITPASGFVEVWAAAIIGLIVGVVSYYFCRFINRIKLDDVLDVSSLQGAPGIIGSLLVGCFATKNVNQMV